MRRITLWLVLLVCLLVPNAALAHSMDEDEYLGGGQFQRTRCEDHSGWYGSVTMCQTWVYDTQSVVRFDRPTITCNLWYGSCRDIATSAWREGPTLAHGQASFRISGLFLNRRITMKSNFDHTGYINWSEH